MQMVTIIKHDSLKIVASESMDIYVIVVWQKHEENSVDIFSIDIDSRPYNSCNKNDKSKC